MLDYSSHHPQVRLLVTVGIPGWEKLLSVKTASETTVLKAKEQAGGRKESSCPQIHLLGDKEKGQEKWGCHSPFLAYQIAGERMQITIHVLTRNSS